jgi:hypothetical protein
VAEERRTSPEAVAAGVNGCIVMALPLLAYVVAALQTDSGSVTARVSPLAEIIFREAAGLLFLLMPFAVLALLVGARTKVHARACLEGRGKGWRGVGEAAATGALIAVVLLLPATARQPFSALPYVAVYGGGSAVLGLLLGLVLRASALITLRVCGARPS